MLCKSYGLEVCCLCDPYTPPARGIEKIKGLEEYGIKVTGREAIETGFNPSNERYMKTVTEMNITVIIMTNSCLATLVQIRSCVIKVKDSNSGMPLHHFTARSFPVISSSHPFYVNDTTKSVLHLFV